jgi:hypothetical protein
MRGSLYIQLLKVSSVYTEMGERLFKKLRLRLMAQAGIRLFNQKEKASNIINRTSR